MGATKSLGQAGVVIEAPGADVFARRLQRWSQSIENAKPEFESIIREVLRPGEAEVFNTSGAAINKRWPAAVEPDRKSDPRLLFMSGELYRSLASLTSDSVQVATRTELHFTTRTRYAHFHQHGTSRMAARPFMGISSASRKQIMDVMHRLSVLQAEQGSTP
jgi:phage gpG-like protein